MGRATNEASPIRGFLELNGASAAILLRLIDLMISILGFSDLEEFKRE